MWVSATEAVVRAQQDVRSTLLFLANLRFSMLAAFFNMSDFNY